MMEHGWGFLFALWIAFSFISLGLAILKLCHLNQAFTQWRRVERGTLCFSLGAAMTSLYLSYLGFCKLLYPSSFFLLSLPVSLWHLRNFSHLWQGPFNQKTSLASMPQFARPVSSVDPSSRFKSGEWAMWILFGLIVFGCITIATTSALDGDALQYHVGLPLLFLKARAIELFPSLPSSGQYLGNEILYTLTLNSKDATQISATKYLNIFLEMTLPFNLIFAALRLGAQPIYAVMTGVLFFSVSSLGQLGYGSVDCHRAAIALLALSLLSWTWKTRSREAVIPLAILVGFSVSVVFSNILVFGVALCAVIFLFNDIKLISKFLLISLAFSFPWVLFAWIHRGLPFYPIGIVEPPYYEKLSFMRNTSGYTLGLVSFVKNFVPRMIEKNGGSMGWLFILAIPISVGFFFQLRALRRQAATFLSGLAIFLIITLKMWVEKIAKRYLLIGPACVFPYFMAGISENLSRRPKLLQGVFLTALAFFGLRFSEIIPRIEDGVDTLRHQSSDRMLRMVRAGPDYPTLIRFVNRHPKEFHRVLINDAMVYFLDIPFFNAHSLHSFEFRYDLEDSLAFTKKMNELDVNIALFRGGISGVEPQLTDHLNSDMRLIAEARPVQFYIQKNGIPSVLTLTPSEWNLFLKSNLVKYRGPQAEFSQFKEAWEGYCAAQVKSCLPLLDAQPSESPVIRSWIVTHDPIPGLITANAPFQMKNSPPLYFVLQTL